MGSTAGHLQGGYVYNGSTYSDLTRADRATFGQNDAYTIVDLSGGLRWGGISVELYVNNVFDELARYSAFAGCTTSVCGVQPYYVSNAPRTIGLKFSQEF